MKEWWFSHISKAYLHSHMTNTWVEIANQRFGTRLNAVQIFSQDGMQAQDKDQQEAKLMGVKYTGTQGKEAMQRGGQP